MGTICTTPKDDDTEIWAITVARICSGAWWEETRHAAAILEKALGELAPKLMAV